MDDSHTQSKYRPEAGYRPEQESGANPNPLNPSSHWNRSYHKPVVR